MPGKFEELMKKIEEKINDLTTLEIVTAVGEVKFRTADEGSDGIRAAINTDKPVKAILTRIDLLDGDIRTVFDEAFVTGEYKALKSFHTEREKQGHDIIEKNLKALQTLYNMAKNLKGD